MIEYEFIFKGNCSVKSRFDNLSRRNLIYLNFDKVTDIIAYQTWSQDTLFANKVERRVREMSHSELIDLVANYNRDLNDNQVYRPSCVFRDNDNNTFFASLVSMYSKEGNDHSTDALMGNGLNHSFFCLTSYDSFEMVVETNFFSDLKNGKVVDFIPDGDYDNVKMNLSSIPLENEKLNSISFKNPLNLFDLKDSVKVDQSKYMLSDLIKNSSKQIPKIPKIGKRKYNYIFEGRGNVIKLQNGNRYQLQLSSDEVITAYQDWSHDTRELNTNSKRQIKNITLSDFVRGVKNYNNVLHDKFGILKIFSFTPTILIEIEGEHYFAVMEEVKHSHSVEGEIVRMTVDLDKITGIDSKSLPTGTSINIYMNIDELSSDYSDFISKYAGFLYSNGITMLSLLGIADETFDPYYYLYGVPEEVLNGLKTVDEYFDENGLPEQILSQGKIIECLTETTQVNVVENNGTNKYVFNNSNEYVENKIYGLSSGTYIFKNISESHPMAILNAGKTNLITYSGDSAKKLTKSVSGTTADDSYDFYWGDITVTVIDRFEPISVYCYYHGYMGGENLFKYESKCVISSLQESESRQELEAEPESRPQLDANPDPNPEPKPEPRPPLEPLPEPELEPETRPLPELEPEPEPKPDLPFISPEPFRNRITVANDGNNNRYLINGFSLNEILTFPPSMEKGKVYLFDQSDRSNENHPIGFSYDKDGTHSGGSEIPQINGTEFSSKGTAGIDLLTRVKIGLEVESEFLNYYCKNHAGMGYYFPLVGIDTGLISVIDLHNEGYSDPNSIGKPKSLRIKKKKINFKETVFDSGLNRVECAIIIAYGAQLREGIKAVLLTEILIEMLESERSIYYEVLGKSSDNTDGNPKGDIIDREPLSEEERERLLDQFKIKYQELKAYYTIKRPDLVPEELEKVIDTYYQMMAEEIVNDILSFRKTALDENGEKLFDDKILNGEFKLRGLQDSVYELLKLNGRSNIDFKGEDLGKLTINDWYASLTPGTKMEGKISINGDLDKPISLVNSNGDVILSISEEAMTEINFDLEVIGNTDLGPAQTIRMPKDLSNTELNELTTEKIRQRIERANEAWKERAPEAEYEISAAGAPAARGRSNAIVESDMGDILDNFKKMRVASQENTKPSRGLEKTVRFGSEPVINSMENIYFERFDINKMFELSSVDTVIDRLIDLNRLSLRDSIELKKKLRELSLDYLDRVGQRLVNPFIDNEPSLKDMLNDITDILLDLPDGGLPPKGSLQEGPVGSGELILSLATVNSTANRYDNLKALQNIYDATLDLKPPNPFKVLDSDDVAGSRLEAIDKPLTDLLINISQTFNINSSDVIDLFNDAFTKALQNVSPSSNLAEILNDFVTSTGVEGIEGGELLIDSLFLKRVDGKVPIDRYVEKKFIKSLKDELRNNVNEKATQNKDKLDSVLSDDVIKENLETIESYLDSVSDLHQFERDVDFVRNRIFGNNPTSELSKLRLEIAKIRLELEDSAIGREIENAIEGQIEGNLYFDSLSTILTIDNPVIIDTFFDLYNSYKVIPNIRNPSGKALDSLIESIQDAYKLIFDGSEGKPSVYDTILQEFTNNIEQRGEAFDFSEFVKQINLQVGSEVSRNLKKVLKGNVEKSREYTEALNDTVEDAAEKAAKILEEAYDAIDEKYNKRGIEIMEEIIP